MSADPRDDSARPLGIGWRLTRVCGWGVYGINLLVELASDGRYVPLPLIAPLVNAESYAPHKAALEAAVARHEQFARACAGRGGEKVVCPFPVLHPLGNRLDLLFQDQVVIAPGMRAVGTPNVGVVFMENTNLGLGATARAAEYDAMVAGSTWNTQVLKAHGIANVRSVFQGVDPAIFHPAPSVGVGAFKDRYVVFSGGKLEYRKGQDIVVAAFKAFHARHPDALLAVAWQNIYPPETLSVLERTGYVEGVPSLDARGFLELREWLLGNGLPEGSFLDLGSFSNHMAGQILREVDVALFPNRCEGGTNLVAMETMACGVPVILSANTGHLDLIREDHCFALKTQSPAEPPSRAVGVDGWGESDVDEIVDALETAYADRAEAARVGRAGAEFMADWTWESQAGRLITALEAI
ncbi:glycosyltransferase family 4 protein [Candidatus Poribacteria bacterium]|nr:glycosyltransferase family 4 protein [Candidatus Poribacteria bacterium]MBT5713546.1 glycosyltransferase family 4 protein [Candidatus Poribacteria bacterium]MBT7100647.1 glycosyltransferase family 4 protein [Candidatus Poribacteria bacterium]MBT7808588.1 glycosyltransferase family 4 protein [Candidatus Poribacteria bacterium]